MALVVGGLLMLSRGVRPNRRVYLQAALADPRAYLDDLLADVSIVATTFEIHQTVNRLRRRKWQVRGWEWRQGYLLIRPWQKKWFRRRPREEAERAACATQIPLL
jgi:hypothetical protein